MRVVNKAEIIRESRHLNREQMKAMLKRKYGIPASSFERIMFETLPKESEYQSAIIGWLRSKYPCSFVWKAAAGPYSQCGIPDICAIIDGRYFGFEVKRPFIGKPTRIQEETIKAIKRAGGIAAVVSFPEQAQEVIEESWMRKAP